MADARAPHAPRLDPAVLRAASAADVVNDAVLRERDLGAAFLSGEAREYVELAAVRLDGADLADSDWHRATIADAELTACDLANARFGESGWVRARLERCRLTGTVLAGCTLRDVTVTDGTADLLNLRFATLERVRFQGLSLAAADLYAARLDQVSFVDCELGGADFTQARCTDVRLERCRLAGLKGVAGLAGATIDPLDVLDLADQLAAALSITIARERD